MIDNNADHLDGYSDDLLASASAIGCGDSPGDYTLENCNLDVRTYGEHTKKEYYQNANMSCPKRWQGPD